MRKTLSPDGAASARDPTAPSALADPGLVLVRGPDRPDLQDERKGWIMSVKLTKAQLVMMSAAAYRKDRCLSAPATIKGAALSKVSAKLAMLGLAREIEAKPGAPIWSRDDAGRGYALKLTAAGLKAVAVDEGSQDATEHSEAPQPQTKTRASPDEGGDPVRVAAPRDGSKLALVIELLQRADGETIVDLTQAMGWLPLDASVLSILADIEGLDLNGLRRQWRGHLGGDAPAHLPHWLLMRVLAYRLQSDAFGGFDKSIRRILRSGKDDGVGAPFDRREPQTCEGVGLKAGALLVREWKGRLERVMILEEGFAWNGQTFGSLSQIAKAITGTTWNRAVLPVQEPHRGRLRRRLVRQRSPSAGERGSAGKARGRDRKAGLEEMTSVLHVRVPLLREGGVPSDLRFWTPLICAQDSMQTIDITY